jgi:LacI family transcriptional regulator
MEKRNTIEDVARLAGVSKVTVSYVLNGRATEARISAGTEERVIEVARELGYRPNALAKMLLKQKTDTIAVVFQYATYFSSWSNFIAEAMHGVCEGCVETGMDLLLHTKAVNGAGSEADVISDGRVDGALVLRDVDDQTQLDLLNRKFPSVLFFTRTDDPDVPFVDADNYSGGRLAAEHLISLGHKRLGMIRGPHGSRSSTDRLHGFRSALEEASLPFDPEMVVTMETPSSNTGALIDLMNRKDRPTALFVWSDDVAFNCLRLLCELGLAVPKDVSIVGFDSTDSCDRVDPKLTSIRQPIRDMARRATILLASIVHKQPVDHLQVVFPLAIDVRGSTSRPELYTS